MSGHEFEKQVRQKLNDLKLMPSANAWVNIENKLRERKRRVAPLFWLPLLLIGLGTAGYFIFRSSTPQNISSLNKTDIHPKVSSSESIPSKISNANSLSSKNKNSTVSDQIPDKQKADPGKINIPEHKRSITQPLSTERELVTRNNNTPEKKISPVVESSPITAVPQPQSINQSRDLRSSFSLRPVWYPAGSLNNPVTYKNGSGKFTQPSLSLKKTTPRQKKTDKWLYGLSASAGVSAVNEGKLISFNNTTVEDVSALPSFAPSPIYKPSSISPGFTYSAGVFVKRELSKRFSVSAGLNYLQLNTRNKVGYEMNGTQVVNNGGRGYIFVYNYFTVETEQSEYRNRYHFVEVPVVLHTRINKSSGLPMHVNTGVAVSQLLHSNSLHFDGTSGVYYKNDRLLNRTQFAVNTGLSFGLLNKTTRPIWIGPSARYNVSKILQKDVRARKNFMSLGIEARLFIR